MANPIFWQPAFTCVLQLVAPSISHKRKKLATRVHMRIATLPPSHGTGNAHPGNPRSHAYCNHWVTNFLVLQLTGNPRSHAYCNVFTVPM